MSLLLSIAKAQSIVDLCHPRVCETRERSDGEVYEREVYPYGPSPQVSHTYLIYAEGIGHKYYAIATEAGLKKYSDNRVDFEVITAGTPLAHTIISFRQAASFSHSGTKWYILSEDGRELRTPQECVQIERQYQLRLTTNSLKNRLVGDANNLSHFSQLSEHQPDVQYATDACNYLLEEPFSDIEVLDNLLQELLKFEANKLVPMRQRLSYERDKANRQQERREEQHMIYVQNISERRNRLQDDLRRLAEFADLEIYRDILEQEWEAQVYFEEQELRHIDRLELELHQANKREATKLTPMRQATKRLEARRAAVRDEAQDAIRNRSLSAMAYTDAVKELATLHRYHSEGAHKSTILPRANYLRQRCIISREGASTTNPVTKNSTHQNSGNNGGVAVGAILGAFAGLLVGGLPGAMAGAAIGGALGASEDGTASPSSSTSAEPVQSFLTEREKWIRFINKVDNLIHSL